MIRSRCPRTPELLAAVRRGGGGAEAGAHAASCRECADALLVERFLAGEATAAAAEARLPDPAVVQWRARRARSRHAADRALTPIAVWERIAAVAAAAGVVAAAVAGGVGGTLSSLFAEAGSGVAGGLTGGGLAGGLPLVAAGLLIAIAAGGVWWSCAEE